MGNRRITYILLLGLLLTACGGRVSSTPVPDDFVSRTPPPLPTDLGQEATAVDPASGGSATDGDSPDAGEEPPQEGESTDELPTPENLPLPPESDEDEGLDEVDLPPGLTNYIFISTVQVSVGQFVTGGNTDLPGDACVVTQLEADGETVSWWPSETCADREDGDWSISIPLGQDGRPDALDTSTSYILHAWDRDNPIVESPPFPFDLSGPPDA